MEYAIRHPFILMPVLPAGLPNHFTKLFLRMMQMRSAGLIPFAAILIFMLSVFFYNCHNTNAGIERTEPALTFHISEADIEPGIRASDLIDSIELIALDTVKSGLVSSVSKLQEAGSHFYILDTYDAAGLFTFNRSGAFVRKTGRKGLAKGEYQYPNDFFIDSIANRLYILNTEGRSINIYDSRTGNFLSKQTDRKLFYGHFTRVNNNLWVFGDPAMGRKELLFTDNNMQEKASLFPFSAYRRIAWINHSFSRIGNSDTVLASLKGMDTIFHLNGTRLIPHVAVDFGEKKLTHNNFYSAPKHIRAGTVENSQERIRYFARYMRSVNNYIENTNIISFTFEYNLRRYQVLYHKKNRSQKVFDAGRLNNDVTFQNWFPTPMCTGADGTSMLAFIPAEDVPQIQAATSRPGGSRFAEQAARAVAGLTPASNNGLLVRIWFKQAF